MAVDRTDVKDHKDLTLGEVQAFKEEMEKSIMTVVQNRMKKFHEQTGLHVIGMDIGVTPHPQLNDGSKVIDEVLVNTVSTDIHI